MISTIVFDWGGVLIQNPTQPMITYLSHHLNIPPHTFTHHYKPYMQAFQKGTLTEIQLWHNICTQLNIPPPTSKSLWKDAFAHAYHEHQEMFSLAYNLKKQGYTIGFLSNTEKPAMEFFYEQHYTCFDVTLFSCHEGTRKPEPQIYQRLLQATNTQPQQVVFIDDQPTYIKGAQKLGINTILFTTYQEVLQNLKHFNIIPKK